MLCSVKITFLDKHMAKILSQCEGVCAFLCVFLLICLSAIVLSSFTVREHQVLPHGCIGDSRFDHDHGADCTRNLPGDMFLGNNKLGPW